LVIVKLLNLNPMIRQTFSTFMALILFFGCETKEKPKETVSESSFTISEQAFGVTQGGDSVTLFTFANGNGLEVKIMNYGGIVTHLSVPDEAGKVEDIVLGFDQLADYEKGSPYFGAIVGRYGNRIAKGKFTLNGTEYTLAVNNNENHLHGGLKGFDKVVWDAKTFENADGAGLILKYLSADMEEGYPGNLDITVTYTVKANNEIEIDYHATTDKPTVANITQHSYFNLTGNTKRDILDHDVMIKSNNLIPVDAGLIPTGQLMPVAGTPFDFNDATKVGARIDEDHEQMKLGGGYDHCWVLNKSSEDALEWVVKATDTESGRVFELATSEPGVQFYTGNFLDGTLTGKGGAVYEQRYGLCFEPEHFPDSPNQANFPSVILNPGEEYSTTTIWKFGVVE
jgi:aldose 1-epimerase